jgi:hypothetical protein
MKIPVRITTHTCNLKVKKRPVTHLNLIEIPMNKKSLKNLAPVRITKLPNVFLSNVRAICNKVDDLDLVLKMNEIDLAGITETWLNSNILDSCVNIQGYNIVRNDRTEKRGGGVCVFVKSSIPFVTLPNLGCPNHECLWVKLRPYRLPREISCIIVCVLYNPPLVHYCLFGQNIITIPWSRSHRHGRL